jgi:hypothetical protein
MRIALFVLGVMAIMLGITLTLSSSVFGVIGGAMQSVQQAVEIAASPEELAVQACTDGERLVKVEGGSEYRPGIGSARPVAYYCENASGDRRDVTGEFATEMLGDTLSGITNALNLQFDFRLLLISLAGVVMIVISRLLPRPAGASAFPGVQVVRMGSPGAVDLNALLQQAQANSGGDLTARLQQLEALKAKGLISQTEYDRLRQQILNSIG